MEVLILFVLIAILGFGCVHSNPSVSWPSRIIALAIVLIFLGGCSTLETSGRRIGEDVGSVVKAFPDAVGAVAGAAVFGGEVSMVPAPDDYLAESVSREGRMIYNESRRAVQRNVSDIFRPK